MTRRLSPREIERAIEDVELAGEGGRPTTAVAHRDPRTGDLLDADGAPFDEDPDLLVVMDEAVVMDREQAEAEGREILGPAESETNPDAELVRVPWGAPA